MKNALIFSLLLTSLLSCKIDSAKKDGPSGPGDIPFGGMEEPTSLNLTYPEIQIGKRICGFLERKLTLLEDYRNNPENKLIFIGEAQNCFAAEPHIKNSEFAATVRLVGTDYELQSMRNEYFRDIITAQSGIMESVCPILAQSGEVQRRIAAGNSQFVVKFLVKDSYDRIEITQQSPNGKGGYTLLNKEGINFITQATQGPKTFLGMEKERIRYSVCPQKSMPAKASYLKQTLVTVMPLSH